MRDAASTNNQSVGGTAMFHGEPNRPAFQVDENNTVYRFFPKEVRLTLPDHTQRRWPPGLQRVPRELADHQWLKDNGVVELNTDAPLPPMMLSAPPGTQAHAATIMQSGVYDVSLIRDPATTDAHVRAMETMARMAAENLRSARENLENAERVSVSTNEALASARDKMSRQSDEPRIGGETLVDTLGDGNPQRASRPGDDQRQAAQTGTASLKSDGPTVEAYVKSGYLAKNYPPDGYASRSSDAEILAAVEAQNRDTETKDRDTETKERSSRADKLKAKDRKDYDTLNTDKDRDAFLSTKGV